MDDIRAFLVGEMETSDYVANIILKEMIAQPDIMEEFKYWLDKRQYPKDNPLRVRGYSAEDIAKMAPFLDGIGAYNFLISLRTDYDIAMKAIESGFPRK